ncbi:MAG: nodulation protein NfeD [Rhodospirillales bacterium]|nr:nodulation protein NfeD [Rhodospirillales bacterium]
MPRVVLAIALALFTLAGLVAAQQPAAKLAVLIRIEGPIGPATSEYVGRAMETAAERQAALVILQMDTPGGLDTSMRDIIRDVLSSAVPVVGFVAPQGARAASAGTYIMYASHVAAMAPGTNLGAATPVQLGGGSQPLPGGEAPEKDGEGAAGKPGPDAMASKAINDAAAYIRSLAELRGRNADWAERAVREAASLSANQALKLGVIEVIAEDVASLLAQLDGRTVSVGAGERRLDTDGAVVEVIEPDWRTELLSLLTNPNVAFILMLVGVYGLIFELSNPGAIFPGVLGAVCLMFGLYALNVLPVNYAGLALVVLGIAFMVAEAFLPSFGVLGIGGLVAFAAGATILFDTDIPGYSLSWPVIIGTTVVMAAALLLLLAYVVKAQRRPVTTGQEHMIGALGRVVEWQGTAGRVRVDGDLWRAVGHPGLAPGKGIRVIKIRGLTLTVEAADNLVDRG